MRDHRHHGALAAPHPFGRVAVAVARVVQRHHFFFERVEHRGGIERVAPLGVLRIGAGNAPAVVLVEALGPPAVENADVEPAVDGGLDAGGAAGLERRHRIVEPDVDAGHQPARQLQVVVLEEHHVAGELRVSASAA